MISHSGVADGRLKVMILVELNRPSRLWDEVLPTLRSEGVNPVVGSLQCAGGLQQQLALLDCATYSLGARSSRDYPRAARHLGGLARRDGSSVMHGVEPIAGVIGDVAGLLARVPLRLYHRQHIIFADQWKANALSQIASRLSHVTLACSKASARAAEALDRAAPNRVWVAHNGAATMRDVLPDEVDAARERLGIPVGARVVSFVGRLEHVKGVDLLIRAMANLRTIGTRPVHLVLVGSGSGEAYLRQLAVTAGVRAYVHFVGYQDDVALWFTLGDVVAMPSRSEALGIAGAEAMACGRPLVAAAVGGLTELVDDGRTGLLVPPENELSLAEALRAVLRDRAKASEMGARGAARYCANFTARHMAVAWATCYREALARRGS